MERYYKARRMKVPINQLVVADASPQFVVADIADRVIVMADGRVVEEGRHSELVAAGGTYADLWAAWTRHHP